MSNNEIKSVGDTVNNGNMVEFNRLKEKDSVAKLFLVPFTHITPEYLWKKTNLDWYQNGFDIIYERFTLQMYSADRINQLYHLKKISKPDAVIILAAKFSQQNHNEYIKRELIKDNYFKSLYFTHQQITEKDSQILQTMNTMLVTMEEMKKAIEVNFNHAAIVWSSTNFYCLVISNSLKNIQTFIKNMKPPCIPEMFSFEKKLPLRLVGLNNINIEFENS